MLKCCYKSKEIRMGKELIIDKTEQATDIIPLHTGQEHCAPSHRFGPFARNEYLLHFCLSGKGTLWDKYGTHPVKAGELFVIRPGEITTYEADATHPWHYIWIGFSGKRAAVFHTDRSVYPCPEGVFRRLCTFVEANESAADIYTATIHEIIYHLFSDHTSAQDAPSKIKRYIDYNYMKSISVESIGTLFGYERTYLYRIFKGCYGIGVKDYITKVRMTHAHAFLQQGNAVHITAAMTGYADAFAFSKAYKKYYGCAPRFSRGCAE